MSDLFYKPYIDTVGGPSGGIPHFPYTREKLCEKPIFPAYVFDGGAFFMAMDTFGTADGDELLDRIMDGTLFEYWKEDGVFDWYAVWNRFAKQDYTPEWEAHIWLARLYVLLPLAQRYCKTHDARYARKWFEIVRDWAEKNPYTTYDDRPTDLVWQDMQVAWRTINLVHSVFLLGEGDALAEDEWRFVWKLIAVHADHLYKEGVMHEKKHDADNHHLQIGMALTMLGVLLPELGHAEERIRTGMNVVSDNLRLSIYPDGVNDEDSPSYCHFIARLYLEAELLLEKNGLEPIAGCRESLQKQYEFLYQFASPAGKTVQFGDTYAMDAEADVEFVNGVFPLTYPRVKKSVLFADSRMAVLRSGEWSVYVDAMDMTQWHQHYGRPQFVAFAGQTPLVVDSGSVNYDRYDLRVRLNGAAGHNVVSCEEFPLEHDLVQSSVSEKLAVTGFTDDSITLTNTVSDGRRQYVWERRIVCQADALRVIDRVEASEPLHFTLYLHLPSCRIGYYKASAPVQPVSPDRRAVHLRRGAKMETVECSTPFDVDYQPCVSEENRMDYAEVLTRRFHAASFCEETVISLK